MSGKVAHELGYDSPTDQLHQADPWHYWPPQDCRITSMHRFEIQLRRRDGQERRIVLDRFWSIVATLTVAVVAIAVLAVALVLGYLVIGVMLVVALIALVVAVLRSAWFSVRR